mgnify:CR=1 FL=1
MSVDHNLLDFTGQELQLGDVLLEERGLLWEIVSIDSTLAPHGVARAKPHLSPQKPPEAIRAGHMFKVWGSMFTLLTTTGLSKQARSRHYHELMARTGTDSRLAAEIRSRRQIFKDVRGW